MPRRFNFNFLTDLLGEEKEEILRFKSPYGRKTPYYTANFRDIIPAGAGGSAGSRKGPRRSPSGPADAVFSKSDSRQNCVFKSCHRYDKTLNRKHFEYIQREGKGRGGENPELYGADPDGYEKRMAKLHFRFIISPENQNVDLSLLTSEFIRRLELRTGYRLDWVASEHFNTGKKHSHVLINGFDLNGRKVQFNRDEIKYFMRDTLRDVCTEMAGHRTYAERQEAFQKQCASNSHTPLDRRLNFILSGGGRILSYRVMKMQDGTLLHKRLLHLKELGLADYDAQKEEFIVRPDWIETLRLYGKYNTFLDGLKFTGAHPSRYKFHNPRESGPVTGKIIKKYFMQDDSNNHAVILETSPNTYAYVPLYEAPSDAPAGSNVQIRFERIATPAGGTRATTKITGIN